MEIQEIKQKLRYGDVPKIAALVRCSSEMVRNVIVEESRNKDTELGEKITKISSIYITSREKLEKELELTQGLN